MCVDPSVRCNYYLLAFTLATRGFSRYYASNLFQEYIRTASNISYIHKKKCIICCMIKNSIVILRSSSALYKSLAKEKNTLKRS